AEELEGLARFALVVVQPGPVERQRAVLGESAEEPQLAFAEIALLSKADGQTTDGARPSDEGHDGGGGDVARHSDQRRPPLVTLGRRAVGERLARPEDDSAWQVGE